MKLKEHTRNQKRMYRIHKQNEKILDLELMIGKLQKETKQLNAQINEYQKALDDTMSDKIDIENNWKKLKEYVGVEWYSYDNDSVEFKVAKGILNKMQELERSDNNGIMD